MATSLEKLRDILKLALPGSPIPDNIEPLGYGVLEEWDSLANYAILIMVEEKFNFRFSMRELAEIRTVKEILEKIDNE